MVAKKIACINCHFFERTEENTCICYNNSPLLYCTKAVRCVGFHQRTCVYATALCVMQPLSSPAGHEVALLPLLSRSDPHRAAARRRRVSASVRHAGVRVSSGRGPVGSDTVRGLV